jgi:hypothetical protein
MNRYKLLPWAVILAVVGCSTTSVDSRVPQAVLLAESTITAADIHGKVAFLASDELEGRDTPSRGLEIAAAWIADEFQRVGLEPGASDGWLQRYPFRLEGLDPAEARVEISSGATHALEYGSDFFAEPGSSVRHAVGVVYVGDPSALARGPEGGLRDRAVLVRLGALPEPARGGVRFDAATRANVNEALERARDAGAAAVVFVLDDRVTRQDIASLAETAATPARVLGGVGRDRLAAFYVHHQGALRMFRMAGLDGPELLRAHRSDQPIPLPGVTTRLAAPVTAFDDAQPPNVVGLLRGSDPVLRETYVVISAHMDHLGIGRPDATGDSIYNGADDNASGTAGLMAIAAAFAGLPEPAARSVIFLAVSGEEKGLLGSRWFADHPPVPLEAIVANINLDMISRNQPDDIVVIGKEYSSLGPLVREVAIAHPRLGLQVSGDRWPEQRFFFRSDHYSFAERGVPAIFFFSGTHEDYHRPSDRVERIDADKAARVARLAFLVALEVAERAEAPSWDPARLEEVRNMARR